MDAPKASVPDFNEINVADLLKRPEDEFFDRTRGGQDNIGKAIAGFGTKHGGLLLVGQEDFKHGGGLSGISDEEFQKEFTNAISNVKPTPLTRQKIVHIDGKKVAVVSIQDVGSSRPCSYGGIYYERKGDSTARLNPDEVKSYHLLYGSANAEDMPTHAKRGDVDDSELILYSSIMGKSKENVLETVISQKGFLTVRGAVVLAAKPVEFLEGAFVEVQRYDSVMGSPPVPIGSALRISMPARQMIEETAKTIEQNLPVSRAYEGAKMIQSPAIPSSVIREVITNAVAHRNYRSHEHVRVRIYSDGFDVNNPALINERMWADILANQTTYHPNEGVYTFLSPTQLYEGRGEGIWKVRQELERLGKASPEFKLIGDSPSAFYVRINLSPAKRKDVKRQKLDEIVSKKKEITSSEVMARLKVSRVTAITMLGKLVEQGRLEHQGSTKTSKYIVKR